MDALLTQREVAETINEGGGDYVMGVFGNQPTLHDEIAALFAAPGVVAGTLARAATTDIGHGRIEHRRITTSTALCGYSKWSGLAQVLAMERAVRRKSSGEQRAEIVYGARESRT